MLSLLYPEVELNLCQRVLLDAGMAINPCGLVQIFCGKPPCSLAL